MGFVLTLKNRCDIGISVLSLGGLMNKADLIVRLSEKENVPSRIAKVIVDLFFDGMKEALVKGERIDIRDFGTFVVNNYGGYKGRNPKTGKVVDVPPRGFCFSRWEKSKERKAG